MAVYFLRSKHVSRGKGARATRSAAYRAGERIRDERTGEVHNFSDRRDVVYKEVVLPEELADRADMAWTHDRSTLWNAAEHAGLRRNSRLAREWLVFLPPELNPAQRSELARTFAQELADKYRCAVDLCIHEPRPGADPRNHHAHLLMTVREVTPDGFGPRTSLEHNGRERFLKGLSGSSKDEYLLIRERWAQVTNQALRQAALDLSIDHRSLERQGLGREPALSIPDKVFYAERKAGGPSVAGDAIRARHHERTEARLKSDADLARVIEAQKSELKARAREEFERREGQPKRVRWNALTLDERNAHRRAQYEARRVLERQDPEFEARRRETGRRNYHAQMQKNPEAVRAGRRHWRQANAPEVNRKQREYRHARAERERSKSSSPTADQSYQNWLAYRAKHGPGPTADESARAWRELRERQASLGPESPAASRAPGREARSARTRNDELDPKPSPDRDHDYGR